MSRFPHYQYSPARVEMEIAAMRQRLRDCVAKLKADQQPLAQARRAKQHAAFMALLDADMARVAELDRAYAAKYLAPKVEDAA